MRFPAPLVRARLLRRYKRFLADCTLSDGREVTAHVANPGAMTGLAEPGTAVWLEPNDDPRRKLGHAWRLSELEGGGLACVDTSAANRVVGEALRAGRIADLGPAAEIRAEVPYAEKSRVDFLLRDGHGARTYLEVKSVTLCRNAGLAEFPDTVTARGARHLRDLALMAGEGHRAVLLFLLMRSDCTRCTVAADIDPAYAAALHDARAKGVEILCHDTIIDRESIEIGKPVPVIS